MNTPIAFTYSPLLQRLTTSIDRYRVTILLTPLNPQKELALRSSATQSRILIALAQANIPMTATELSRLRTAPPKRPHPMDQEALLYRQALLHIRDEWTGVTQYPSLSDIEVLMHISQRHSFPRISRIIQDASPDIATLLAYIHTSTDHPVVLAGITHAYLTQTPLHTQSQGRMTLLLTSLILARAGYDARGMLALEASLVGDHKAYTQARSSITSYGQMTIWLEYFATCTEMAYKTLETRLHAATHHLEKRALLHLNDRQKHILLLLDTYGAKITNREVQKRFGVSQITASRDLARLLSAGHIASHGNGRSISYSIV